MYRYLPTPSTATRSCSTLLSTKLISATPPVFTIAISSSPTICLSSHTSTSSSAVEARPPVPRHPLRHPSHLHAETTIFDCVHQKDETIRRRWVIFIRMILTDVPCIFSAIRIPIVFHRLAICATSRRTSMSRIKTSQGIVLFARKRLRQAQRARCERGPHW